MDGRPQPDPLPLARIVGRDDEIAAVEILLREARLVTITGLGGIGKSRLAEEVARRSTDRGRSRLVVNLDGITRLDSVLARMAVAAGMPEFPDTHSEAVIIEHLDRGPTLLVLDGFEDVIGASPLVRRLLSASSDLQVLITSRMALRVAGEREFPLGPLNLPTVDDFEDVSQSAAGALFIREARRIGTVVGAGDAAAIAGIVRHLGGWPLLIELAAMRTRLLPPRMIADRLDQDLPTLPRTARGAGDAIDVAIDWVLGVIEPEARDRVVDLGVFPRRFGIEALHAVWGEDPIDRLDELVRLGLVRLETPDTSSGRFELPAPISDALRRRLFARGDEPQVMARLTDYVKALTRRLGPELRSSGQLEAVKTIAAEINIIRLVFERAISVDPPTAAAIVIDLDAYWKRLALREGHELATSLLGRSPLDDRTNARLLEIVAIAELLTVDIPSARERARQMLDLASQLDDPELLMSATLILGMVEGQAGELEASLRHLQRAAALAGSIGDAAATEEVRILGNLGLTLLDAGDVEEAIRVLRSAADRSLVVDDSYATALNLLNLAEAQLIAGLPDEADRSASEAAATLEGFGDNLGDAFAVAVRAATAAMLGDRRLATERLARAATLALDGRELEEMAIVLQYAAVVYLARRQSREAARLTACAGKLRALAGQRDDRDYGALHRWITSRARSDLESHVFEAASSDGREADPIAVLSSLRDAASEGAEMVGRYGRISAREAEVLALVADGASDSAIGAALFISPKTVSVHVSNLKSKLGAETRIELAMVGRDTIARGADRKRERAAHP